MSIKQLDEFIERQGIKSAELCKIIDNIEFQLKQKDEQLEIANDKLINIDIFKLCNEQIEKLQAENKIMKETVEFYADKDNWKTLIDEEFKHCLIVKSDTEIKHETLLCGGKRARQALERVSKR